MRARRAAQLRETGLQIVSPHGNVTVRPNLVTADDIDAPYDAVLLAVKAYSLDAAIPDFATAVGPETAIIPMLNGMRHIDILEERFGKEAVVGGVCKVAATIDTDGRIVQLAQFQELAYGERDGSVSPRMERLHAFMQGAGFDARLSRAIEYEMWEKWVMLATIGGITCLMRGNIGEVVAAPGGASFILSFLDEVISVVCAVGQTPKPAAASCCHHDPPSSKLMPGVPKLNEPPRTRLRASTYRSFSCRRWLRRGFLLDSSPETATKTSGLGPGN